MPRSARLCAPSAGGQGIVVLLAEEGRLVAG
jgi:hypothetical protein